MLTSQDKQEPEIDLDALARKYAEEREKRLSSDAVGQYQSLTGRFASFDADPNAAPDFDRAPVVRTTDVLIIGRGYGGLISAVQLRQRGVPDMMIGEKGKDCVGTRQTERTSGRDRVCRDGE